MTLPCTSGWSGQRVVHNEHRRLETEPFLGCFLDHPAKGHIGQTVVGITAPNVSVHAGEPDLPQPARRDLLVFNEILLRGFIPRNWVEGSALVVQTQRLSGMLHIGQ